MKSKNMLLTLDKCLEQEKTGRKTGLLVQKYSFQHNRCR